MERAVKARKVRLVHAAPDGGTNVGFEWSEQKVNDLVVFPESRAARCRIGGATLIGVVAWAQVDPDSQAAWEAGGSCKCPMCDRVFANEQALGSHLFRKHQQASDEPTEPESTPVVPIVTADSQAKRSRAR
jgi:hypothetical protein